MCLDEYQKTANHKSRGPGVSTLIMALISTELKIASDFFQVVADFLGPKYEDTKKKGADYVDDVQKKGADYVNEAQKKLGEYQNAGQEKAEDAKKEASKTKEDAKKEASKTKQEAEKRVQN